MAQGRGSPSQDCNTGLWIRQSQALALVHCKVLPDRGPRLAMQQQPSTPPHLPAATCPLPTLLTHIPLPIEHPCPAYGQHRQHKGKTRRQDQVQARGDNCCVLHQRKPRGWPAASPVSSAVLDTDGVGSRAVFWHLAGVSWAKLGGWGSPGCHNH